MCLAIIAGGGSRVEALVIPRAAGWDQEHHPRSWPYVTLNFKRVIRRISSGETHRSRLGGGRKLEGSKSVPSQMRQEPVGRLLSRSHASPTQVTQIVITPQRDGEEAER
jgi:hypothetical protein